MPTIQLFNPIAVAAIGGTLFEEFSFYRDHVLYACLFGMALLLLFTGLIIILVCRHRAANKQEGLETSA